MVATNIAVGIIDPDADANQMAVNAGLPNGRWPVQIGYNDHQHFDSGQDWDGRWANILMPNPIQGPPYMTVQVSPFPWSVPFNASDWANNHRTAWDNLAKNINNYGSQVLSVQIGWEWNRGGAFDKGQGASWDQQGMQSLYITWFRNVAQSFKTFCPDVIRCWAMNHGFNWYGRPEDFYPGDDVVDAVGLEVYEQYINNDPSPAGGGISASVNNDFGWIDNFTAATFKGANHPGTVNGVNIPVGGKKYMVFAEWQQNEQQSTNYIRDVFAWANNSVRKDRVLAMLYWDAYSVAPDGGGLIDANNDAGRAFVAANLNQVYAPRWPIPRFGSTQTPNIVVTAINSKPQNTPFVVSGVLQNETSVPVLQYNLNGGAWSALPAGFSVTTTAFSFTVPGQAQTAAGVLGVRDANNNAINTTAPYAIGGPQTASGFSTTLPNVQITNAFGEVFAMTAGGQVESNGSIETITTAVDQIAYVNGVFWQHGSGLWYSKVRVADAYSAGTDVSPLLAAETLAIGTIAGKTAGVAFVVSGTIGNITTAPTLQYSVTGGTFLAMPAGASVTATTFSFTVPAQSASSSATISVKDVGTGVVALSNTFAIVAAPVETLAIATIGGQNAAVAFPITGSIGNVTVAPTLQYQVNASGWLALPGGASVTTTTFGFTVPGMVATSSATISVRDANATSITATSNTFSVAATPVESITVAAIAQQTTATTFTVSGTVINAASGLALQYQDNGGVWQSLPAGAVIGGTVGNNTYSFTHPTMAAAASNIVAIRDTNNNAITASSAAFAVIRAASPNNTVVTATGGAGIINASGEAFTITASRQVAVNGVTDTTTSNVAALAYVGGAVWYETTGFLWRSKTVSTNAWAPSGGTVTSPLPPESLSIATPGPQTVNIAFAISGSIGNALVVPSLQYVVGNGTWGALPVGANVSLTGFSFTVPGIATAGSTTVSVRDTNAPSILAVTTAFNVAAVITQPESLTIRPILTQTAGVGFTVSGVIAGVSVAPQLEYQDNAGAFTSLPVGASSATAYSFVHPGMAPASALVVTVRDRNAPTIKAISNSFLVAGAESQSGTIITSTGQQIIDQAGNRYTMTAEGGRVAVNGTADGTTSNVIEIAYVNRVVWYENTSLQWFSRAANGTWSAPTLTGPVASSLPVINVTNTNALAVVPGFTIALTGVQLDSTITAGNFVVGLTVSNGLLFASGGSGSGTPEMTISGSLASVNNALATLMFKATKAGTAVLRITATDSFGVATTQTIRIAVPRAANSARVDAHVHF